jgi:endoglucanase
MNEPYLHDAKEWAPIAQAAILSIRETGANQAIFVPGTLYSSASRWMTKDGALSNGEALKDIYDPINNIVFEAHSYFDNDSSGTKPTCSKGETIGVERLKSFTGWLRENNFKGFLGEFGVSEDPTCLAALDKKLAYMDANSDVWYGWSYWAASPWFGDYMFNVYPPNVDEHPQLQILKRTIDKKSTVQTVAE